MRAKIVLGAVTCALWALYGCNHATDVGAPQGGNFVSAVTITLALNGGTHDVGGFLYNVECDGSTYEEYEELAEGYIPDWLMEDGAGDKHHFADLFMMLPAGECTVMATPMKDIGTPSEECSPVSGEFEILAGKPTEILLMAQCKGEQQGSVDIVAGLNDPPIIESFQYDPSKFIDECQTLQLIASVTDPNGDLFEYMWSVIDEPLGAVYELGFEQGVAQFSSETPGQYLLRLKVRDIFQGSTIFEFIVHVLDNPELEGCEPLGDVCCGTFDWFTLYPETPSIWHLAEWEILPADECLEQEGGSILADSRCEEICCMRGGAGTVGFLGECEDRWTPPGAWSGHVFPIEDCEDYCCYLGEESGYGYLQGWRCPDADRVDDEYCDPSPDICCHLQDSPVYELKPQDQCINEGRVVEQDVSLCESVCCYAPHSPVTGVTTRGMCLWSQAAISMHPVEECQSFCCMPQPPHYANYGYELLFGPECPKPARLDEVFCTAGYSCCATGWLAQPLTPLDCGGYARHPDECGPLP